MKPSMNPYKDPSADPPRDWHSEPELPNEKIEIGQADPVLQQEVAGPGRIAIYALGAMLILGVVLYGLNRPPHENVAAQQGASGTASSAPPERPTPSQDAATKGGGQSGQPGGQPANATTGVAPQDEKKQPQNNAQQKKPEAQGGDQGQPKQ